MKFSTILFAVGASAAVAVFDDWSVSSSVAPPKPSSSAWNYDYTPSSSKPAPKPSSSAWGYDYYPSSSKAAPSSSVYKLVQACPQAQQQHGLQGPVQLCPGQGRIQLGPRPGEARLRRWQQHHRLRRRHRHQDLPAGDCQRGRHGRCVGRRPGHDDRCRRCHAVNGFRIMFSIASCGSHLGFSLRGVSRSCGGDDDLGCAFSGGHGVPLV
ncbi:hypothetical protein EJ06DRAFT_347599 [Trichodelitschia bisporula]|uniref:Uncharacterized protein n=1 Tax=Trichodelitschia bisporula TaxID=703511 RepID=A0A6G1I346_9PEZI|nr:hypothetical protein EJ06DRAFT_347599 [Trichodelitschia bisporula]